MWWDSLPPSADDEEILSSVHVSGGIHTGYRLTAMPLNWKQDPYRLLCRGNYEVRCHPSSALGTGITRVRQVWWVQRTRWNFQIEFKKKFAITDPAWCVCCDATATALQWGW